MLRVIFIILKEEFMKLLNDEEKKNLKFYFR